ncbi:hypothetical protein K438DRAFT_1281635 [Mycena galopus ATCC 62051]|nr:hypothetical protein K438DRAFT_1281635 [Mycena galopus ATCC 62051]
MRPHDQLEIRLNPAKEEPTASRPTLTLTYSRPGESGETHHAVVPFPERYEQAVTDALRLLGKYMENPTPQASGVLLKYRNKAADGEWIWGELDPANWLLVVQPGSQIGLFEGETRESPDAKNIFWSGPVYVFFGATVRSVIKWTDGSRENDKVDRSSFSINRPVSYQAAVEAVRKSIPATDRPKWKRVGGWPVAIERVREPGKTLTFYLMKDRNTWIPFPSNTSTDDEAWKAFVPEPLGIMGVIAR